MDRDGSELEEGYEVRMVEEGLVSMERGLYQRSAGRFRGGET